MYQGKPRSLIRYQLTVKWNLYDIQSTEEYPPAGFTAKIQICVRDQFEIGTTWPVVHVHVTLGLGIISIS